MNSKRWCGACCLISNLPSSPVVKLHLNWRRSVILPSAAKENSRDRIETHILLVHSTTLGKVCLPIYPIPGLKNTRKTQTHAMCSVREMVSHSRTLAAFPEDQDSIPSTHMAANKNSRGPSAFFWSLWALDMNVIHSHTCRHNTQTHKWVEIKDQIWNRKKNIPCIFFYNTAP